jgi:hypothetical protein
MLRAVLDSLDDPAKKRVVICGYPKSGNTWITRLVADMLDCPVVGYLNGARAHAEEASEGHHRVSDHEVYKSHIECAFLALKRSIHSFVYVLRDPRDVVCSGAHYFDLVRFHERYGPGADRYEAMTITLLRGGVYTGCKRPWRDHVRQSFPGNVCTVRYEDMLAFPVQELTRIADSIGRTVPRSQLEAAISRQSFDARKEMEAENSNSPALLRNGVAGAYRKELSPVLSAMIEMELRPELEDFGYLEQRR